MGRKAKFDGTTVPTGRGRKAKKQGDPTFPKGVLVKEEKHLSHRQKQRARKRLLKRQSLKENIKKLKKEKREETEDVINENNVKDVSKQLQKKKKKSLKAVPLKNGNASDENEQMQFDKDSVASDAEGVRVNQKQKTRKKITDSDIEEESDQEYNDSDESDQDEEMGDEEIDRDDAGDNGDIDDDDDLLPIERANKKLKKKQEKEQ